MTNETSIQDIDIAGNRLEVVADGRNAKVTRTSTS